MKIVFFFLFFLFLSFSSFAGDPGYPYGCWTWLNNKVYTHWWKDDIYPGWGPTEYHYYDENSGVIIGTYGVPSCGEINTGNGTTSMFDTSPAQGCFINIGGTISQGSMKQIVYSDIVSCNVPLDGNISFLILLSIGFGFYFLRNKQLTASKK